jgi:hypothetical protein
VILHRLATLPVWALFTAAISIPILTLWLTGSAAQQRQSPYLFLMNGDTALSLLILAIGLIGLWAKRRAFNERPSRIQRCIYPQKKPAETPPASRLENLLNDDS